MHSVLFAGFGSEIPPRRLTNAEIESFTDTTAAWIETNVGIKTRSRIGASQSLSDLGAAAATKALAMAGVGAREIDFVLCATNSQDDIFPSTASKIQHQLAADRATSMDLQAGCTGWLYGMRMGTALVQSGQARNVLVVGVESLIRSLYLYDRNSALFGDAAGATIITGGRDSTRVRPQTEATPADSTTNQNGFAPIFTTHTTPSFALHHPAIHREELNRVEDYAAGKNMDLVTRPKAVMDGRASMKLALATVTRAIDEVLELARERGVNREDVKVFVPHQTNIHVIKKFCDHLGFAFEDVPLILDKYGCVSTASIPTALSEHHAAGRVRPGDLVLCAGYGAGWTAGALLFRWDIPTA
ncbi:MAG: ketoacyl-ACP synthase III [Leptospirales bacterium]|jgi:3-oxoacyl-[acyl-carrier-protein] synthase-3